MFDEEVPRGGLPESGPKASTEKVSLSNRRETSSLIEPFAFGLDRLSVSFEVYDYDSTEKNWDSYTAQHSTSREDKTGVVHSFSRRVEVVDGVSAFVGVRVMEAKGERGSVFGKIEFNPARIADPSGFGLASVDEGLAALVAAVEASGVVVVPVRREELATYKLKRVDVAKDFHSVVAPSALIRGLAPIARPWSRKNLVHADPSKHGAQTLMVGSNSGIARLYDKFAETAGGVDEGTVRFEVEGRSDWVLKYGKMRTAADLDLDKVGWFARDRWEWSKMGTEVHSTAGVVEVVARSGLTPREQQNFIGWLVMQSTPYAYEPSKATLAKFRRLQRELNIVIGPDVVGAVGFSTRLDWDTGEVITRVS